LDVIEQSRHLLKLCMEPTTPPTSRLSREAQTCSTTIQLTLPSALMSLFQTPMTLIITDGMYRPAWICQCLKETILLNLVSPGQTGTKKDTPIIANQLTDWLPSTSMLWTSSVDATWI
jgi:hypothetical protein